MTPNNIPEKVCVIWLGNICRSPAGEYLLRHFAKQSTSKKVHEILFDSAGIWAGSGNMNHMSSQYLQEKGIETSSFRSKAKYQQRVTGPQFRQSPEFPHIQVHWTRLLRSGTHHTLIIHNLFQTT